MMSIIPNSRVVRSAKDRPAKNHSLFQVPLDIYKCLLKEGQECSCGALCAKRMRLQKIRDMLSDEEQCLKEIWRTRYGDMRTCPKCHRYTKFHRIKSRKVYVCNNSKCGHHIAPLANTIFHKSSTPLSAWFLAMCLMDNVQYGINAKKLEHILGVSYKTARRMQKQIGALTPSKR